MVGVSKDFVAQLVEHLPFKERVLGSSPSGITLFSSTNKNTAYMLISFIANFHYLNFKNHNFFKILFTIYSI